MIPQQYNNKYSIVTHWFIGVRSPSSPHRIINHGDTTIYHLQLRNPGLSLLYHLNLNLLILYSSIIITPPPLLPTTYSSSSSLLWTDDLLGLTKPNILCPWAKAGRRLVPHARRIAPISCLLYRQRRALQHVLLVEQLAFGDLQRPPLRSERNLNCSQDKVAACVA